ncbi:hypothetical protein CVT25_014333 [Psilocybe cyanescens]|uniref:Uncharacterized protein n=1 Tax=Psilocybe cyanescens TaxID=93625 RepID=A0A409XKY0_PSICY|nr:hypothetical protein CVT25_014333 [Psilocybe cyanescens]
MAAGRLGKRIGGDFPVPVLVLVGFARGKEGTDPRPVVCVESWRSLRDQELRQRRLRPVVAVVAAGAVRFRESGVLHRGDAPACYTAHVVQLNNHPFPMDKGQRLRGTTACEIEIAVVEHRGLDQSTYWRRVSRRLSLAVGSGEGKSGIAVGALDSGLWSSSLSNDRRQESNERGNCASSYEYIA